MMVINLPENKAQIQNLYENFFNKLNSNNTLAGTSLSHLQDENEIKSKTNSNKQTYLKTKTNNKINTQIKTSEKVKEKIKEKEKEEYNIIDFPEKGIVNNLPFPNKINNIGTELNTSKSEKVIESESNKKEKINEINENKKKLIDEANANSKAQEKIKIDKEIEKSEDLSFPITRKEKPHEIEEGANDKLGMEHIKLISEENKINNLRGFSFLQKRTDNEIFDDTDIEKEKEMKKFEEEKNKADEKIKNVKKFLNQMKLSIESKNKKIKENLGNCKKKCSDTCKRFTKFSLKNESFDLCKVKCELACTENAFNILIK
jgi:hypothetical protein